MTPEIKQQWVAALRSGNYQQGRWHLCRRVSGDNKEWCCLGVLCDILLAPVDGTDSGGVVMFVDGDDDDRVTSNYLPAAVVASTELESDIINGRQAQFVLADMNDGVDSFKEAGPADFSKIADFIEEKL